MKNFFSKKIIASILIISFVTPNLFLISTQKAKATGIPVIDALHSGISSGKWAWDKAEKYVDKFAAVAGRLLARALLQVITQDTINWINSGFQGSPAFMTDPAGALTNAADQAVGQFILQGPLDFLCEPFQLQVKMNLGLQYSGYNSGISCTMSGVLGNIQGAYDDFVGGDFIGGGGWDSWMQMASNPQNTPQGAAMMAEGALEVKIAGIEKINILEANWGSGAMSLKKCQTKTFEDTKDAYGNISRKQVGETKSFVGHPGYATGTKITTMGSKYTELEAEEGYNLTPPSEGDVYGGMNPTQTSTLVDEQTCETTTPGTIISEGLKVSEWSWVGSSQLAAEMGDSINAILGAFATQLVKMTLSGVKEGILGSGKNKNVDYMAQLDQQMSDAQTNLDLQTQSAEDRAAANPVNTAGYGTSGTSGIDTGNPFITRKNNATSQINNLIDINNAHKNTYTSLKATLESAKTSFEEAKACAQSKAIGGTDLNSSRAGLIQNNLLTKITDTNTTASTTPLSIPQVNYRLDTINANISHLQTALSIINSATTEEAIDTEMTADFNPVKTSTDAIAPSGTIITDTKAWLTANSVNLSDATTTATTCHIDVVW